jgi:hypothetical protein
MGEDIGWMVFGVAVAVLGIAITYAIQRKPESRPKDPR